MKWLRVLWRNTNNSIQYQSFVCTQLNFFTYSYIIIIIIMSCRQHGYPWPSLTTSPYRSSPQAGLQGYIPYPHIAAECMFELVVLLLPGHMWGSIGVHHLWARPCFSSSVLHVWFVMGGRWSYSWCLDSNGNEEEFQIPQTPSLKPHHQMCSLSLSLSLSLLMVIKWFFFILMSSLLYSILSFMMVI